MERLLAERGLGSVEQRIRLKGSLHAEGNGEAVAELCLGARGAWVVTTGGQSEGRALDAADGVSVQYEQGRLRDRLVVSGTPLTVPAGKAEAVKTALALGRLRRNGYRGRPWVLPVDRYVDPVPEPVRELVSALIPPPDVLLALVQLDRPEVKPSELGALATCSTYLLSSADQLSVFTLSELGDLHLQSPEATSLALESKDGSVWLHVAGERHSVRSNRAVLLAELLELLTLPPSTRLYEGALRLFLTRERGGQAERSREMLRAAAERGRAEARLALLLLRAELEGAAAAQSEAAATLDALRDAALPAEAAAGVLLRWTIGPGACRTAVTLLSAFGARAEPWALALHRTLRETHRIDDAAADLELAEHELASGDGARARRIAENRLAQSVSEEDAIFAPEKTSKTLRVSVRLHEVLKREAERGGRVDHGALAALARLDPFNVAHLTALAQAPHETPDARRLGERASEALVCLAAGGLHQSESMAPVGELPALTAETLDRSLRHPLARRGRLATRLSELVAATPEPDLGFLRDFCEELSEERYPEAARALARASRLLGLPRVNAYVSHGARSLGMRAFGAREPFVLVGQSHLSESGSATLYGRELDFAFGAELSHLAFGHQRVTASEVWMGAAGKTRDALMAVGFVLPFLSELSGQRTRNWLARFAPEALGRAAEGAVVLDQLFGTGKSREPGLGQRNEELIAAHRLVQLSADRAGLVACRSLRAALRAMLLGRAEYHRILHASRQVPLFEALGEAEGSAALTDLRVRLRALVAFHLSPEFDRIAGSAPVQNSSSSTYFTESPRR